MSNQTQGLANPPTPPSPRRSYVPPRLTVHGSAQELTASLGIAPGGSAVDTK